MCGLGSVRFRPEQICAITDLVSEQQRSVRSISKYDTLHVTKKVHVTLTVVLVCDSGITQQPLETEMQ